MYGGIRGVDVGTRGIRRSIIKQRTLQSAQISAAVSEFHTVSPLRSFPTLGKFFTAHLPHKAVKNGKKLGEAMKSRNAKSLDISGLFAFYEKI